MTSPHAKTPGDGESSGGQVTAGCTATVRHTADHFVYRLLTECLNQATRQWWLRRASQFEAARPRLDDFHGQADREQLRQRWNQLTDIAQACRRRAQVSPLEEIDPDVSSVLDEVFQ